MLYHISPEMPNPKERILLSPRVPKCRTDRENDKVPRICFSDSILGCLRAIPDSYDGVYNRIHLQETKGVPALFAVYAVNEKDIPRNCLFMPEELKNSVPDALETGEHWVAGLSLIVPLHGLIWVKNIQTDQEGRLKDSSFLFSRLTKRKKFHFTFVYDSELFIMQEMVSHYGRRILEAEEIPVEEECNFSFVYTLTFLMPRHADMREIWKTYYDIRLCYDEELFEEDFEILQNY